MMVVSSTSLFAGEFDGRYVIESATHTGKFLRGLPQQANKVVTADGSQATVFAVIGEKNDAYSLQTHVHFLSLEQAGDAQMHKANGAREKFKITKNSDGTFSLQAVWNGKYLSVKKSGDVNSSARIGADEKFKLQKK